MTTITLPATTGSSSGSRTRAAVALTAAALLPLIGAGRTSSMPDRPAILSDVLTASHLPGAIVGDGPARELPPSATAIRDLKRHTGLTWGELARLFGVSRRTVHNWDEGGKVSQARERRLHEIAALVADFPVTQEAFRGALRSVSGGRPIIDIVAMGASVDLIKAHLSGRLGPSLTRIMQPASPIPRLGDDPPDARLVNPRSLLANGALPHLHQEGTGEGRS